MISAAVSSLAPAAFAEKPAPLDAEFLDYLAACEGKDDNWTVIADGKQRRKEKTPPAVTPVTPAEKAARKPEVKP